MKRVLLIVLSAALFLVPSAFSQSRDTGAIRGIVVDDQHNPLPGVNVILSGARLMGDRASVTDTEGAFRFPAVPPGQYSLKAELQGFATVVLGKTWLNLECCMLPFAFDVYVSFLVYTRICLWYA